MLMGRHHTGAVQIAHAPNHGRSRYAVRYRSSVSCCAKESPKRTDQTRKNRYMIRQLRPSYLNRSRQIAISLSKYGFGGFAGTVGTDRFVGRVLRLFGRGGNKRAEAPVRLRKLLEELGTTFIKLGQIMSTRSDLLDSRYQSELAKLQDDVKPEDEATISALIESELGMPVKDAYMKFDLVPLAAASIGQVHAAELHDGTKVAVKVRRPNILRQIEIDLSILHDIAANATNFWPMAKNYDLPAMVEDFAHNLRLELDYRNEARNLIQMSENFADNEMIRFPAVHLDLTTEGVLTMERMSGTKINDKVALAEAAVNPKELAHLAASAVLKMVFEDGLYHADPHPGNFFVENSGRIILLDFGMVGVLDEYTQDQLIDVLMAISGRDTERLIDTFEDLGMIPGGANRLNLRMDLGRLMAKYRVSSLSEININEMISETMSVFRKHKMQLPGHHAVLLKVLLMLEGLGKELDPDFDVFAMIEPYAKRLIKLRYGLRQQKRRGIRALQDVEWLSTNGPHRVRRMLLDFERQGFRVNLQEHDLAGIYKRIERTGAWIALGVMLSSLLVAMAILIAVNNPTGWEFAPRVFFSAVFIGTVVIGLFLSISLFLARKRSP